MYVPHIANFLSFPNSIFRNILSYFIISLTAFVSVDVIVDSLSILVQLFYFFLKRSFWASEIYPWKITNGFLCQFTILTFPIIIPIKNIKTTFVWNFITWMITALFKNNVCNHYHRLKNNFYDFWFQYGKIVNR